MNDVKQVTLCARINIRKWGTEPRLPIIVLFVAAIMLNNVSGLNTYCSLTETRISPWITTALCSQPVTLITFACLGLLLFSGAPFGDALAPFVMIRTGKRNWILGQLLYIAVASLLFVLLYNGMALLMLLPSLGYSLDWGTVIRSLAAKPSLFSEYQVNAYVYFDPWIVNNFSAVSASLLCFLLMWLVTMFTGTLVLAFNVVVAPGSGTAASGLIIAISGFMIHWGIAIWGYWAYYLTPYLWHYLSLYAVNGAPLLAYSIAALLFAIILLSSLSVAVFCRKDCNIQKGADK